MQKWFMFALAMCVAAAVQAGEGKEKKAEKEGQTKEEFLAQQKKMAEKKGKEFDQEKQEKRFERLDKDGDGILTTDEKGKGRSRQKDKEKDKKDKGSKDDE